MDYSYATVTKLPDQLMTLYCLVNKFEFISGADPGFSKGVLNLHSGVRMT